MNVTPPRECMLWQNTTLSIEQLREVFERVCVYEDESHLVRSLVRCTECGHLYFHEFYEEVDWTEGNDAQYMTWIPVDDRDSAEELSALSVVELLSYLSIRYDRPGEASGGSKPYWCHLPA